MNDVSIDFNAGGNLGASLTQMIQQTTEAAKVTDGLVGQVGRLNSVTMALINRTAGLTGANKIATAQAAAYQEAMSGIAATAAVTGQSFQKLEQTTLKLGRSIPGGIGEAVRIVQTLQSSGITAEKQIERLGKTFAKLGEANGTDGAMLGKQMLSLTRIFGNSEDSVGKFGDSLTSVSKKFGASAMDTAAFAKALAPVASSVGMSETAVLGLSAAAARLGEDGYAGANAFNKVLLDMQRSVRDGTPELQSYAKMLNLSSTALRDMFKSDPTEVLVRFTEAIKKNSPEAQRGLERLGFDSTRTVRSLKAISGQGNLRQVVESASSDFGGGSTGKAAETAIGGVNAQAKILAETLNQTVASAGRPFLDWLGSVISLANKASGAVAGIMESAPVQTAGKVAAPVATVAGAGMNALGTASMVGLGLMAYKGAKKFLGNANMAASQVATTGETAVRGLSGRLGTTLGNAGIVPSQVVPPMPGGMRPGEYLRTAVRGGANLAATNFNLQSAMVERGLGRSVAMTPGGITGLNTLKAGKAIAKEELAEGRATVALTQMTNAVMLATKQWALQENAGANLTRSFVRATVAVTELAGAAGKAALTVPASAIGKGNVGRGFGMMGLMVGGMLAYEGYSKYKEHQGELEENVKRGTTDSYGAFNDFAAAAGIAGKGMLSLAEVTRKTTRELQESNKNLVQAYKLTSEEFANAKSGTYQRAFTASSADDRTIALEARLLTGANASPQAVARIGTDVANQFQDQQKAQDVLRALEGFSGQKDVSAEAMQALSSSRDWHSAFGGMSETQSKLLAGVNSGNATTEDQVASLYGEEARNVARVKNVQKDWKNALAGDGETRKQAASVIASSMGIKDATIVQRALSSGQSYDDFVQFLKENKEGAGSAWNGVANTGKKALGLTQMVPILGSWAEGISGLFGNPLSTTAYAPTSADEYGFVDLNDKYNGKSYADVTSTPIAEGGANKLEAAFDVIAKKVDKSGGGLADALYGVGRTLRKFGEDNKYGKGSDWTSKAALAMDSYMSNTNATTRGVAGGYLTRIARQRYGNETTAGLGLLQMKSGETDEVRRAAFTEAQQNIAFRAPIQQVTMSLAEQSAESRTGAAQARAMGPLENSEDESVRRGVIDRDRDLFAQRLTLMKQFVMASRQLDRQLARQDEEARISKNRSEQDYNTQRKDAEADYNKSVARANFDYNQSVARAEEDFQKQRSRATRDFNKSQARSEEDFNTQRSRSIRDFSKSMKRMMEDQAASIYDPYKRIQAQQVYDAKSLLTNLQQQNEAMVKQTQNLAKAKSLGLSQAVIDQLKLSDAGNAQQLERLLQDMQGDPSLVGQYNQNATERQGAATNLTEQGVGYQRQLEDFNQGLKDSEADFKKSSRRARADFRTSMSDSIEDFQKQLSRGAKDFAKSMSRGEADYLKTLARAERAYNRSLDRMDEDLRRSRRNAQRDLARMGEDTTGGLQGLYKEFTERTKNLPKGIRAQFSENLKDTVKNAGTDLKNYLATADSPYQTIAAWLADALTGGTGDREHTGQRPSYGSGAPSSSANTGARNKVENIPGHADGAIVNSPEFAMIAEAGPEAVIPLNARGIRFMAQTLARMAGGMAATAHSGDYMRKEQSRKSLEADDLKALRDAQALVAKTTAATAAAEKRQREADRKRELDERKRKPESHLVSLLTSTAHTAHMAHAAHTARGARHTNHGDVRTAQTARYSSPTTNNYHYDHRTQFNGPLTVKASDPKQMVDELRKEIAKSRLVAPGRAMLSTSV